MNERETFFYDNAGWSYNPATENPEDGRQRCARALAAAEARLHAEPFFITIEPDPEPWDGEEPYDGPLWVVSLFVIDGVHPAFLGSLGSVACEEGDDYLRVVAAELALEYLPPAAARPEVAS